MIKAYESRAKEEADKQSKGLCGNSYPDAADHVAETTISVVQLPNDEMKGRIIGRGRNIRTLRHLQVWNLLLMIL